MDIKMKYNVGDRVAIHLRRMVRETCPYCCGDGEKTIVRVDYESNLYEVMKDECPACEGRKVLRFHGKQVLGEGVIRGMSVFVKKIEDIDEDEPYTDLGNGMGMIKEYYLDTDEDYYSYAGTKYEENIYDLTDELQAQIKREAEQADAEANRKLKEALGS